MLNPSSPNKNKKELLIHEIKEEPSEDSINLNKSNNKSNSKKKNYNNNKNYELEIVIPTDSSNDDLGPSTKGSSKDQRSLIHINGSPQVFEINNNIITHNNNKNRCDEKSERKFFSFCDNLHENVNINELNDISNDSKIKNKRMNLRNVRNLRNNKNISQNQNISKKNKENKSKETSEKTNEIKEDRKFNKSKGNNKSKDKDNKILKRPMTPSVKKENIPSLHKTQKIIINKKIIDNNNKKESNKSRGSPKTNDTSSNDLPQDKVSKTESNYLKRPFSSCRDKIILNPKTHKEKENKEKKIMGSYSTTTKKVQQNLSIYRNQKIKSKNSNNNQNKGIYRNNSCSKNGFTGKKKVFNYEDEKNENINEKEGKKKKRSNRAESVHITENKILKRNESSKNRNEINLFMNENYINNNNYKDYYYGSQIKIVHSKVEEELSNIFKNLPDCCEKDPEITNKLELLMKNIKDIRKVIDKKTQTQNSFRPKKNKNQRSCNINGINNEIDPRRKLWFNENCDCD